MSISRCTPSEKRVEETKFMFWSSERLSGKYACNLHLAWDIGLIEHAGRREADYVSYLEKWAVRRHLQDRAGGSPENWANESFALAKQVWLNDGSQVGETYFR